MEFFHHPFYSAFPVFTVSAISVHVFTTVTEFAFRASRMLQATKTVTSSFIVCFTQRCAELRVSATSQPEVIFVVASLP